MREIKFRAWDTRRSAYPLMIDFDGLRRSPLDNLMNIDGLFVMQYTGLKDKNGVGIYEGDLVVFTYENGTQSDIPYQVMFENAAYWMQTADGHHGDWVWGNHERLLVIGNIYQNPELLEPTENK